MGELIEWWEDLHDCSTGSQLVRLAVPPGWGRSTVLDALAEHIGAVESRPGAVLRLAGGEAPDGLGLQIEWLSLVLESQGFLPRVRRALGVDRTEGVAERGLGALGLFGLVSGVPELAAGLPASLLLSAAASLRDRTEAGQLAEVARLANGLATYSTSLPVALLIDDAELLDPGLVERLVFTVLDRLNANVLVIVVATPAAPVLARFKPAERYGPRWERIGTIDVDPSMDESARRRLIEATTPDWPPAVVNYLAAGSRSFSDVWAVLGWPAAADVQPGGESDEHLRVIDGLISEAIKLGEPPPAARALSWAGGLMHVMQLTAVAAALPDGGASKSDTTGDPWFSHFGHAVRFAHKANRERAERSASVLSQGECSGIASATKETARALCDAPGIGVIDLVSALRPIFHLARQGELAVDAVVAEMLARLANELEALGEPVEALRVVNTTLDLLEHDDESTTTVGDLLTSMVLRLGYAGGDEAAADRAGELAEAMEAGAIVGLEASIWTAISLLDRPDTRPAGARIVDAVEVELTTKHRSLGDAGVEWRLLLAFHAGRGGYLGLAEKLLAPLLEESGNQSGGVKDLAFRVLAALGGAGGADLRLHRQALLQEYQQLDADSELDVRLAIVETLASIANRLGDHAQALRFGSEELATRFTLFPTDHPGTLAARHNVAFWNGRVGDARKALALFEELLPDMARVLGPDHPDTLTTRHNVASWTGEVGDARKALALLEALLPDRARVQGPDHPDTLSTRNNVASWTGRVGDAREALALFDALVPDMARVLGPDHPDTLTARDNVAFWAGEVGDARKALALSEALVPDMARVLGPDHPDTLTTRNNVALWTGEVGDARRALALFEALLPDMARVLGPDHPGTLTTRDNVASWTGRVGDARKALELSEALLPDMARVLGPDHPDTLTTRNNVASWTGRVGDAREALALFEALLPDMARVLGPDHPDTLTTLAALESLREEQ